MARRVEWTESAWNDLEEGANFIRKGSRYYAASFVAEIRDATRSLSLLAERGRIVPELDEPSVREIFVRSYRLIYQVSAEAVYVLAVVHGARDLPALWERAPRGGIES
ncbi:MAG: type II toxin-antitoxin system RelE/ParE family toxin [Chloroflexi bacterium]|nr:type II toxin-antitoxin system RelE/ParE family toxin [Chloroflexota bacterium]